MDPITIGLGLFSLATSAIGIIKQQEANEKAKVAADLAIQQATADNEIQRANNDYGLIGEKLKANAERIKAQRVTAELAKKRAKIEQNALLGLSLFFLLAAMLVVARNQLSTTASR